MSVFINARRLLSALPSLSQFGRGRLSLVAISFYALSLLFWAMSLVGIYCGRASQVHSLDIHQAQKTAEKIEVCKSLSDNN